MYYAYFLHNSEPDVGRKNALSSTRDLPSFSGNAEKTTNCIDEYYDEAEIYSDTIEYQGASELVNFAQPFTMDSSCKGEYFLN